MAYCLPNLIIIGPAVAIIYAFGARLKLVARQTSSKLERTKILMKLCHFNHFWQKMTKSLKIFLKGKIFNFQSFVLKNDLKHFFCDFCLKNTFLAIFEFF